MMEGSYRLHLDCDGPHSNYEFREFPAVFFEGSDGPSCRARARREGWRLDVLSGLALCPKCVEAGLTLSQLR